MNYLQSLETATIPIVWELNTLIASLQVYYQNISNYSYQKRFRDSERYEALFRQAKKWINDIEDRIEEMGQNPLKDMNEIYEISHIKEHINISSEQEIFHYLKNDHLILKEQMQFILSKCEEISDVNTHNILKVQISEMEKVNWILSFWQKEILLESSEKIVLSKRDM